MDFAGMLPTSTIPETWFTGCCVLFPWKKHTKSQPHADLTISRHLTQTVPWNYQSND